MMILVQDTHSYRVIGDRYYAPSCPQTTPSQFQILSSVTGSVGPDTSVAGFSVSKQTFSDQLNSDLITAIAIPTETSFNFLTSNQRI